ncbi:MAG TPA: CerR family C-terminal domain-containing protein [Vicinamibacterales bacterium]|nr:CerR family C-terminal domain-containing protein [Vicinamibacterales bacterium]
MATKPRTTVVSDDLETRERLVEVSARLFAERGFSKVTVREICQRANANVAAVNYHFGGKDGLYQEIVSSAIRTMQSTTDEIREAGAKHPAEEQLAIFVRTFLSRVAQHRDGWIHHLMMQEIRDPTPELDRVVKSVVRPRMAYLSEVIAGILHCAPDDDRVQHSVMSVQVQCLALLNDRIAQFQPFPVTSKRIDALAEHITRFSLAGIKALKR